ncbi:AGAP005481-PA-like protein [Anopheles sinensis]|uniref:AGAP005481-PA-like protein n=1 Tax=Anopheles sinensis TaxID=74873 RepID=A0A084W2W7_ANOSI|nr:AGAP005481-PA-like protein [Anopheles sinensis]
MNEKCRLCLEIVQNSGVTSIYDDNFCEKLKKVFLFSLGGDERLPTQVCQGCQTTVTDFYTYSQQVQANQEQLAIEIDQKVEITPVESVKIEPTTSIDFLDTENAEQTVEPSESVLVKNEPSEGEKTESDDYIDSFSDEEFTNSRQKRGRPNRKAKRAYKTKSKVKPEADSLAKQQEKDQRIKDFFTLECEVCSAPLEDFAQLQEHYQQVHGTRGYIRCCNKQFFHRYTLLDHIAVHRGTIRCEICKKSYKTRRYLSLHMAKSHGSEEDRPFKCDKCGIGYPKQYLLRAHETMHVQAECKICNKVLSSHHSLKVHLTQMHSDDSNHICATCGKIFRTKVAMERHIKEHLGLELSEKLQCPCCGKWFNGKYNLKKHVRFLHKEEGQVFRCDICQHESPNSRALSYHKQRVHVEEKHECEYCGKRFKRKLYLREHIASHTGNPLYTCEICGVKFNSHANHFTHRKNKHPVEWEAHKRLKAQEASQV